MRNGVGDSSSVVVAFERRGVGSRHQADGIALQRQVGQGRAEREEVNLFICWRVRGGNGMRKMMKEDGGGGGKEFE